MFDMPVLAAVEVGGYVSFWKLVPFLFLVIVWAKLLTWADKDAIAAHMPRDTINLGLLAGFIVGVGLFFALPNFWLALAALVLLFGVDIGVYLGLRNAKVGLKDLKGEMKATFLTFGKGKAKKVEEVVDQVVFLDGSGNAQATPKAEDPVRPVFDLLQEALVDPLRRNAETIELLPAGEEGSLCRYVVDGVGYKARVLDRGSAAGVVALAKKYAGLDVKDRRKPQSGKVKVSVNGAKHELTVNTAGSSTGESMRVLVDAKKRHEWNLDTLGFTPPQLKAAREAIDDGTGVVLVAAPKGMGLTSTLYGLLRGHDAFVQHLQTVERDPEQDLEGITQTVLPGAAGPGEEVQKVDWVISQQPDVLMVSPVEEQASAVHLIEFAKEHRAYVGLRTTGVAEAVQQWRRLVGDDRLALSRLRMVVAARVVRKLCTACKVAYNPDAASLRKMGMDPEKVTQLYQARETPMRNDKGVVVPCTFCNELRYAGRAGVFEVLPVDDEVRAALAGGSGSALKAAFRKRGGRYMQEAALDLVRKGDTSVKEVLRVLRGPEQQRPAPQENLEPAAQ